MAIEHLAAELWRGDQGVAHGTCHLVATGGQPRGGTVSQLVWSAPEPDLTGARLSARLADRRSLPIRIIRHSHPEGVPVLRFELLR